MKNRSIKKLIKSKKGDLAIFTIVVIPALVMTVFGLLSFDSRKNEQKRAIQNALDSSLLFISQTGLSGKIESVDPNKPPIYICTFPEQAKIKEKFEKIVIPVFFEDGLPFYNKFWTFDYKIIKSNENQDSNQPSIDTFNITLTAYVPIGNINNWETYYKNTKIWNEATSIGQVDHSLYNTFKFSSSTQCRGNKKQ